MAGILDDYYNRLAGAGQWGAYWAGKSHGLDLGAYGAPGTSYNAGTLAGSAPYGYSPTAGGVPSVPDPTLSQKDTLLGNLSNVDLVKNLGQILNDWSNTQAKNAYEQNLPGYSANLAKQSGNVADLLAGKVSQDTWNNIQDMAAERGIATGSYGSPNSNAAMLRALGLTSEQLKQTGAAQFAQQIASTPVGKAFDYQAFLSLPSERQQWEYLANVLRSSPIPGAAQAYNMIQARLGQSHGYNASTSGYGTGGNVGGSSVNQTKSMLDQLVSKYTPETSTSSTPEPGYATVGGTTYTPSYTGETSWEQTGTPSSSIMTQYATGNPEYPYSPISPDTLPFNTSIPGRSDGRWEAPVMNAYGNTDYPSYWPEGGTSATSGDLMNYPQVPETQPEPSTSWWQIPFNILSHGGSSFRWWD